MIEKPARINATRHGSAVVVEFYDQNILDEMSIAQIGEQINQALAQAEPPPRLVLDFGSVAHMSSAALGMLITLHKRIRERNGQLRMCNIRPTIFEVFAITRLNEIFNIFETREAALASLS